MNKDTEVRTTQKAVAEARKVLKASEGDSEAYHSEYDDILEQRLDELDPNFMSSMRRTYDKSGESRWCA